MRKLRVGVWLHGKLPSYYGGAFSYYTELSTAIKNYRFKDAEIVFLSNGKIYSDEFEYKTILWKPLRSKIFKLLLRIVTSIHPIGKGLRKQLEESIKKEADKLRNEVLQYADLIYYLTQSNVYPDVPYVYTLWDLGHFSSYAFPEMTQDENFEVREKHHHLLYHKALMAFAESETGKRESVKYLRTNENRVKVVPIFASGIVHPECASVKPEKMNGSEFFIHYPAQYWAHKNHYNLLAAMPAVIKVFPEIQLILTGSDQGNKRHIVDIIHTLKLEKNIKEIGFVSIPELRWLYEHSQGLVFPSLLGPTNMPPLEAAGLNCPVACTNLGGHIEELGDYGYYFDGLNQNDIAEKIIEMIRDKKAGVTKKFESRFNIDSALKAIDEAFSELKNLRFCWDTSVRDEVEK